MGALTPTPNVPTDMAQRVIFWFQARLTFVLGPLLFLSLPSDSVDGSEPLRARQLLRKLARVDYAGALTLVRL